MFVDDTGAHGAVEAAVFLALLHPDEVVRTIVAFVAIQMVTLLPGTSRSPEGCANEQVDVAIDVGDFDNGIDTTALVVTHCTVEVLLAFTPVGIEDVSFAVREVDFTANHSGRNLSNRLFHTIASLRAATLLQLKCDAKVQVKKSKPRSI